MDDGTCGVPECSKPLRNRTASLCGMHYHRQYRHGRLDLTVNDAGISVSLGRRYRRVYRPGHPLADRSGAMYAHRAVLYDEIGVGPHACYWCAEPVDWLPKGTPGCLQVDHLNGLGDDNRPENLVASCGGCNTRRAQQQRHDAVLAAGWWGEHDAVARTGTGRAPRVA